MEQKLAPLGQIVERLLTSLGLGPNYHGWKAVHDWPLLVGPDIARSARAESFRDGAIIVVVEKDVWRQELELQKDQILAAIHRRPGGQVVKKIVFRAGSHRENKDEHHGD